MKRQIRRLAFVLGGAGYAALGILISRGLIRHLDTFSGWLGAAAGLDAETTAHVMLVFSQLRDAKLVSPWLLLFAGMLLGLLVSFNNIWNARRLIFCICSAVVLLILLTGVALILTEVNSIRVWALLGVLLPMLSALT